MGNIYNINNVPSEFMSDFLGKASTLYLGNAAGSEKIYVNVDKIQPGSKSAKYHSHSKQEEFFLILSGSGTLRKNGEEYQVSQGDFVAKPAGKGNTHQFINTGSDVLEILDIGTIEKGDVVHYPDENMYYLRDQNLMFNGQDAVSDWDTEPNK
ncbi:cupin domain-containing protein [Cohnella abietis]|uniref:Mannose-6-phosphate isomerase n=1 Tax=Cohnella abietis TaxID=2507935 RepID=A0A3T1CYU4_9BACL|nr:cupin domain-containing protein [Cohnella abietis]BBI30939.1 mannose-6-phosphate isomerase [Cohnella abietis]